MRAYILMGSVASGKTTLAKMLRCIFSRKRHECRYVDININHGFTYIVTRLLVFLTRYEYKSNYYLTLRFGNKALFCKYLSLMIILDMLYAPIKLFTSIILYKLKNRITKSNRFCLIVDEFYFNAIVDYIYYMRFLCNDRSSTITWLILKLFYRIVLPSSIASLRGLQVTIINLQTKIENSIRGWLKRERIKEFDVMQIIFRSAGSKVIAKEVSSITKFNAVLYNIKNLKRDIINILQHVLASESM